MNDVTAGSLVRWTMCLNDPRETIVIRGRVRIVEGRRLAYVDVDGGTRPVCLPYGDLKREEPLPRVADVIDFASKRRRTVDVEGFDLTPMVPA